MEVHKISSDLEEDAELEALRLAALATLKSRNTKAVKPQFSAVSQIQPINCIARSNNNTPDQGPHNPQPLWRNNTQLSKKRGKNFPKSQRSNLIVITPVGTNKEKPHSDNCKTSQLLLPQHKWCEQVNEDSSSSRTDRHSGPSRFNRHGSGSESSDSDYDESDDSYSNDTVLQDEHSLLSLAETNDSEHKFHNGLSPEHKMDFQDFDSKPPQENINKNETTTVYNNLETFNPQKAEDCIVSSQNNTDAILHQKPIISVSSGCTSNFENEERSSPISSRNNKKSLGCKNGDSNTVNTSSKTFQPKSKHTPIKFDASDSIHQEKSKHSSDLKRRSSERLQETSRVFKDLRNHTDNDHKSSENSIHKVVSLPRNDLRFELKRKKEISVQLVSPRKRKNDAEHRLNNKRRQRWSRDRSSGRERNNYKRSRSRSYSPKHCRQRHGRSWHSSSSSSRSSSSSISSSSNSSRSSSPVINRSVSSVVQPVQSKIVVSDTQNSLRSLSNRKSQVSSSGTEFCSVKRAGGIEIKLNPRPNFKVSVPGKEAQNNPSEVKKKGPLQIRLDIPPRTRIIQMPKAVEAAFVSTSSDDDTDVNNKCKKPNNTVVSNLSDKFVSKYSDKELTQRSDVPKADRGKFFR